MNFKAILFDCDGVLVDSEAITCGALRDQLEASGRIFSGHEMARSKPAPDVYLAAATHLQVPAAQCLVIEDTTVGVTAGVAAGATVWAYCPLPEAGAALLQAGASQLLPNMSELSVLLGTS